MNGNLIELEHPSTDLLPERKSIENLIWSTIYCPFALKLNEHIDALMHHTEAWLFESGLLVNRSSYQQFHRMNLHWFASSIYSDCDSDSLKLASDWVNMSLIWDEICKRADVHKKVDELKRHAEKIGRVLHGQEATSSGDIPYVCALSALRDRTLPLGGAKLYRRLARDFDAFIRGCVTEVINRNAGTVLDIESYLHLRRDTGVTYPMMELIELGNRIELPQEVLAYPHIDTMMRMACNHVNMVNDLFSLYREIHDNDGHNLALVLHRQGLPLASAVRRVIDYCNGSIKLFMHAEAGLPSFGQDLDPLVGHYIAGLRSFLSGHLHWYAQTERYQLDTRSCPIVVAW